MQTNDLHFSVSNTEEYYQRVSNPNLVDETAKDTNALIKKEIERVKRLDGNANKKVVPFFWEPTEPEQT
ncbi:MAG TPA: hypothetical protein VGN20_14310 [Mucilaginibacter sp.]|jgi:hypothetical protein